MELYLTAMSVLIWAGISCALALGGLLLSSWLAERGERS